MSKKVAFITGITGQDGSYLAEFLLAKGYEVHGVARRVSVSTTERVDHLLSGKILRAIVERPADQQQIIEDRVG